MSNNSGPLLVLCLLVVLFCCVCSSSIGAGLYVDMSSTPSPSPAPSQYYPPGVLSPAAQAAQAAALNTPVAANAPTPAPTPAPANLIPNHSYSITNVATNTDLTFCGSCVPNYSTKNTVVLQNANHVSNTWDQWTLVPITSTTNPNLYAIQSNYAPNGSPFLSYCSGCLSGMPNMVDAHGTSQTATWTQWTVTPSSTATGKNTYTILMTNGGNTTLYLASCTGDISCPNYSASGTGGVTFTANPADPAAQWIFTPY